MMIDLHGLSIGMMFPLEGYKGGVPTMKNQVRLAGKCEDAGFHSLWVRDVPLYDPNFGDAGQMFDPWVYMAYIAGQTKHIKLGTASLVLPLRKPVHIAKSAASIDVLFPGRLHLGVASGDRPIEYPAFNVDFQRRGELFRQSFDMIAKFWNEHFPFVSNELGHLAGVADILPKPVLDSVPMYITGHAGGQSLDWIAQNGDGWMYYPRDLSMTKTILADWISALGRNNQERKPYIQSLYIDLLEQPDARPVPIHLGFRLGRDYLLEILKLLEETGVNHVIIVTKYATRPVEYIIDEIGTYILPHFKVKVKT